MTTRSNFLDPVIARYVVDTMVDEAQPLRRLREETARMENAGMQIGADQGQFMQFLVRLLPVHRYLEIGVFTGYSALAIALAMSDDGRVVACDVDESYTAVARRYWESAGVAQKMDLRLAPATKTLETLVTTGQANTFDMAFIDADKSNVDTYYEYSLRLLRPNGIILVDNVLWNGRVTDKNVTDADTTALRALNEKAAHDERVDVSLLTIGDGLLMARKK